MAGFINVYVPKLKVMISSGFSAPPSSLGGGRGATTGEPILSSPGGLLSPLPLRLGYPLKTDPLWLFKLPLRWLVAAEVFRLWPRPGRVTRPLAEPETTCEPHSGPLLPSGSGGQRRHRDLTGGRSPPDCPGPRPS